MVKLIWDGEEVTENELGQPLDWSDKDIEELVGISEEGELAPGFFEFVFGNAAEYPDLFALLNAELLDE